MTVAAAGCPFTITRSVAWIARGPQSLGDRPHRCLAVPVSRGIGPVEHGADPLANAAGSLRLGKPDLCQHVPDHRPSDIVDLNIAEMGECIGLQRADPLLLVLLVAPGLAVLCQHFGRSFAKRGNTLRLSALEQRIETQLDPRPHFARAFARYGQRYFRCASQSEVTAIAVFLNAHDPALRSRRLDHQIESVAIADSAWSAGCLHGCCRKLSHGPEFSHICSHISNRTPMD
jgi:hypothetical protein